MLFWYGKSLSKCREVGKIKKEGNKDERRKLRGKIKRRERERGRQGK
jgi:hypothetical protein